MWKLQKVYEKLNTLLLLKGKGKKYSIFRSLQDMIFKDYWYFWILHWEIAKIVSLNDLMQWNIVVKITNSIWKTEYPLVIERERKKKGKNAAFFVLYKIWSLKIIGISEFSIEN